MPCSTRSCASRRSAHRRFNLGLAEIERRRLIQTIEYYRIQHAQYEDDPRGRPTPHQFEVAFGGETREFPFLEIGRGSRVVRLRGKIDRIDVVDGPHGRGFRVIDYKSGTGPSASDVDAARMLQLPLYAMAVERLGLAEAGLVMSDVGYWALRTRDTGRSPSRTGRRRRRRSSPMSASWSPGCGRGSSWWIRRSTAARASASSARSAGSARPGWRPSTTTARPRRAGHRAVALDGRQGTPRRGCRHGRCAMSVALTDQQQMALEVPDASVALSAGAAAARPWC